MAHILVHHEVENYNNWKAVFDEHTDIRAQNGSKGGKVFRNANNPDDLFILLEWDNLENAKKFTQSENLGETMQRAGVVGVPEVYYLEETATS